MLAPELIYSFRSLKVLRMLTRNLRCRTGAERSNRGSGGDSVNLVRYLRDLLSVVVVLIGARYHIGGHDAFSECEPDHLPKALCKIAVKPAHFRRYQPGVSILCPNTHNDIAA